ncbi:MAG: acetyl-CoA carboxylase carboxyl transferase subunit alpha [Acidiferrobacteraceae bacterium]|nr:acetyl-CoA carboxylase carboxyl transferase subunit alpha [Acidiferrobacteraceae bacterium]|tara:strand:- start:550 stop:1509 length:960 start_codon:yes stop_codon:yes gene_type:complete
MQHFLDFEKPIAEIEAMIDELQQAEDHIDGALHDEIEKLKTKSRKLTEDIFDSLTDWQVTQVARHPSRPYTLDYIDRIFSGFVELHGDRMYGDDGAIVTGLGRLTGRGVAIIGHQKGRDTAEKISRNFGMPRPEGFRKAQRVMQLAERFGLPIVTLIDTPGAYPGIDAEERGQSEAIARSISLMTDLTVPIVASVIGEGGSGGALAIGVCDRLLMLEYSTYSVISPEGCASILWKNADKAPAAAEAMKLTSYQLAKRKLVDEIIAEPPGGAHRDFDISAQLLRNAIEQNLKELSSLTPQALLKMRYERIRSFGTYIERA